MMNQISSRSPEYDEQGILILEITPSPLPQSLCSLLSPLTSSSGDAKWPSDLNSLISLLLVDSSRRPKAKQDLLVLSGT